MVCKLGRSVQSPAAVCPAPMLTVKILGEVGAGVLGGRVGFCILVLVVVLVGTAVAEGTGGISAASSVLIAFLQESPHSDCSIVVTGGAVSVSC